MNNELSEGILTEGVNIEILEEFIFAHNHCVVTVK